MLPALGSLRRLEHLSLSKMDEMVEDHLLEDSCWLFEWGCLTKSSHLTSLHLDNSQKLAFNMPVPRGAISNMFGCRYCELCPKLQELVLIGEECQHKGTRVWGPQWCVDSSDIDRIAERCTGLEKLTLLHVLHKDATLDGLLDFEGSLRALALSGPCVDDNAAAVLSQLTELTSHMFSQALSLLLGWGS